MAEIFVDLNARIIPADREVYVARPGADYRLYPDFVEHEVVFPELPLLELENGVPLSEYQDDLDKRILRALALGTGILKKTSRNRVSTLLSMWESGHEVCRSCVPLWWAILRN